MDEDMKTLGELAKTHNCRTFNSNEDLIAEMGSELDGVLICTPHQTHYDIGGLFFDENKRRMENGEKPLNILMEKPMDVKIDNAINMLKRVEADMKNAKFMVNHSANYRPQAKLAREAVASGRIGRVRHITAFFAAPLKAVFEDPDNKTWTETPEGVVGNGFSWGQSAHLYAFVYHVCPNLVPKNVYCDMIHSTESGADIAFSASVKCKDEGDDDDLEDVVISASGTTLIPDKGDGAKRVSVEIFGTEGCLLYSGVDQDPKSGRLELINEDGSSEILHEEFAFENLDNEGLGPESLQEFVEVCNGNTDVYEGSTVLNALRAVQTIDAMYKSNESKRPEDVVSEK